MKTATSISDAVTYSSEELDLSNQELSFLSPDIGKLSSLKSLNLRGNSLTTLPSELYTLPELQTLDLRRNELKSIGAGIGALTNLRAIYLDGNPLSSHCRELWSLPQLATLSIDDTIKDAWSEELDLSDLGLTSLSSLIGKLSSLKSLNLRGNLLTTLPSELYTLPELQTLDLRRNELKSIGAGIGALTNLRAIYLDGNPLSSHCRELWSLPQLATLSIDDTIKDAWSEELDLSDLGLTSLSSLIGKLSSLKSLNLRGNSLTTLPSECSQLASLESLDLSRNELNAVPAANLPGSRLKRLNFGHNNLRELPSGIGQLSMLAELQLNNNRLTDIPPTIGKLRRLEHLDVAHNDISALPESLCELTQLRILQASDISLQRLPENIGRLNCLTALSLANNNLNALPSTIFSLSRLEEFNISNNQIDELSSRIGSLRALRAVDLSSNKIQYLPRAVLEAPELTSLDAHGNDLKTLDFPDSPSRALDYLDLSANKLTDLPKNVERLESLTVLKLSDNELSSLPDAVCTLAQLRQLSLANNRIRTVPAAIGSLHNLTHLDLTSNAISALPRQLFNCTQLVELTVDNNKLQSLSRSVEQLESLQSLSVRGNRLHTVPAELSTHTQLHSLTLADNPLQEPYQSLVSRGLRDLLVYLTSLFKDGLPLYETKVVLVGEGNVGKSSLLASLLGNQFIEGRPTTHGIEVSSFALPHPEEEEEEITFNAWDFGGQPVYRTTHQFFYSSRSLYLVVWSPREGVEKNDVLGWLNRIRLRVGDEALIMIVSTNCDTGQRVSRIDETYFRQHFGEMIVGFYEVDSKTGTGIDALKNEIVRAALTLPQMGERFSRRWKSARDEILRSTESHIGRDRFDEICRRHGLSFAEMDVLANLMHDLGHVIHYRHDDGLNQVVVLRPEWLTKAIGFVLEDRTVNNNGGVLQHSEVSRIWNKHGIAGRDSYPPKFHGFFLRLMEKFDVCYRIEDTYSSLVSQLVPAVRPDLPWDGELPSGEETELTLMVVMNECPPGLMPWLIVRTHRYTTDKHWSQGMLLRHSPHGEALLELDDRELAIRVRGHNPSHFLSLLSDCVEFLLKRRWPGLRYSLSVPCPRFNKELQADCPGRLKLSVLHKRRASDGSIMICPECGEDLDLLELLTGFPVPATTPAQNLFAIREVLSSERLQAGVDTTLASQMLRSILRIRITDTPQCPQLFTLTPMEPSKYDLSKIRQHFNWVYHRLTLWCEFPDSEHPVCSIGSDGDGEYQFRRPFEWFADVAPYTILMAQVLQTAMPLATESIRRTYDERLLDHGMEHLQAMELLNERFLEYRQDHDRSLGGDKASIMEFQKLINDVDKKGHFGGLRRVQTPSGDYLWLCPVHYRVFDPGLPEVTPKDFDVFFSYNSQDRTDVITIAESLREKGVRVWLDEWELAPGSSWQAEIEQIIDSVRSAAVFVGKDGLGPWMKPEVSACISEFVGRGMPVIPVLLPGAELHKPTLPIFLRAFTWVSLVDGITDEGIDKLRWGVTGIRSHRA